jgi:hypothetical protein
MWKEHLGRYQNIGSGKTKHGVIKTTRERDAFANASQVASLYPEEIIVCVGSWVTIHQKTVSRWLRDVHPVGRLQKWKDER